MRPTFILSGAQKWLFSAVMAEEIAVGKIGESSDEKSRNCTPYRVRISRMFAILSTLAIRSDPLVCRCSLPGCSTRSTIANLQQHQIQCRESRRHLYFLEHSAKIHHANASQLASFIHSLADSPVVTEIDGGVEWAKYAKVSLASRLFTSRRQRTET